VVSFNVSKCSDLAPRDAEPNLSRSARTTLPRSARTTLLTRFREHDFFGQNLHFCHRPSAGRSMNPGLRRDGRGQYSRILANRENIAGHESRDGSRASRVEGRESRAKGGGLRAESSWLTASS